MTRLRARQASQGEERLFLGDSCKDQDLVFAHADGSAVDPWNFRPSRARLHQGARSRLSLDVVSNRLGHASIGVTVSRYLHAYSDRDAEAAGAFDCLGGKLPTGAFDL